MKKFFKKIVKNWVKIRRKKFKKFEKFSKYEKMLKNKWKLTGNVKKLYITSMKILMLNSEIKLKMEKTKW